MIKAFIQAPVTKELRAKVEEFLDNLKRTVLEQLDHGASAEIGIENHTRDLEDSFGLVQDMVYVGQKWSIDIPNMASIADEQPSPSHIVSKSCPMPSHHPSCDCEGAGGDR